MVVGKHDRMQEAIHTAWNLCQKVELRTNTDKTVVAPFTSKRNIKIPSLRPDNRTLTFSNEVKFLGTVLDQSITWKFPSK